MKDSGIEWIGEIPEDWKVLRLKFLGSTKSGLANKKPEDFGHGYPFISYKNVYSNVVIDNNSPDLVNSTDTDRENYNVIRGDAFFTGSSETIEELGFASMCLEDIPNATYNGFCIRFRPVDLNLYNPDFFKYSFRSHVARGYLTQNDNSITRANLSQKLLKSMPVVIPQLEEQQKIANFLDQKVSEIDHILKKTRESIEEYKKYKQSLITEAVTKGLNPDVEMKDSGIEWIGEIPRHWDTKKMKYCVKLRNEKGIFNKEIDHYIGLENIESFSGRYIKTESLYEGGTYDIFKNGDILFNRLRPYLTKCLMPIFDGFCTGELLIIKEFEGFKKYLFYYLISSKFIDVLNSSTYGTKMPRVSWEFMKELCLTLPNIQEQNQIVNYLDNKCTEIDSLISQKEALLSELETYKKSLIYECVTGKREVD